MLNKNRQLSFGVFFLKEPISIEKVELLPGYYQVKQEQGKLSVRSFKGELKAVLPLTGTKELLNAMYSKEAMSEGY